MRGLFRHYISLIKSFFFTARDLLDLHLAPCGSVEKTRQAVNAKTVSFSPLMTSFVSYSLMVFAYF